MNDYFNQMQGEHFHKSILRQMFCYYLEENELTIEQFSSSSGSFSSDPLKQLYEDQIHSITRDEILTLSVCMQGNPETGPDALRLLRPADFPELN